MCWYPLAKHHCVLFRGPANLCILPPSSADHKELFVRNFPRAFTEDDLKNIFAAFGEVSAIRILRYDDGQSRGIGFVEFATEEGAALAVSLNNTDVGGRLLLVEHSDPKARGGKAGPPKRGGGAPRGGRGDKRTSGDGENGAEEGERPNFAPRGGRGGGRLGLGASRGGRGRKAGLGAGSGQQGQGGTEQDGQSAAAPRSNADFRAMFVKGNTL